MADNYLERKMEEYRNSGSTCVVRVSKNPPGTLLVDFPFRSAFVFADSAAAPLAELVGKLSSTGCKVSVAANDSDAARRIAKAKGAIYIPDDEYERARTLYISLHGEPQLVLLISHGSIMHNEADLGPVVEKALLKLLLAE